MTQRIVICDDESYITRAVGMKLQKAGFDVEALGDGEAAWEAIQRSLPSLLITDYQMPRLDGLQLCRRLREHELTRELPVVLLTAKGYELNSEELISQHGLAGVMLKPFSPRELLQLVHSTIGMSAEILP
jgi:two-component system, OmpR family, alkaline phosphatase synthesis response regulator PhoP